MGRDMADDGCSAHPTMTTAETPRSPTRAEIGRDAIWRRIVRHTIRRRIVRHATTIPHVVPSDGRYRTRRSRRDAIRRRAIRHATGLTARDPARNDTAHDNHLVSGNARNMPGICPEYARNMFGLCSVIPDDVWLLGLSGDRVTGCGRPNAGPQVRRWHVCRSRRVTARDSFIKRARLRAAPAASPAGHVGPHRHQVYY